MTTYIKGERAIRQTRITPYPNDTLNRSSRVTLYFRFNLIIIHEETKMEITIMKWEYNEPHTSPIYSTIKYIDIDCYYKYSQYLFVLVHDHTMFLNNSN